MLTCYRAICRPKYTIGTYNAAAHDGRSHYDGLIGESMKQLVEDIAKALVDIPDEV